MVVLFEQTALPTVPVTQLAPQVATGASPKITGYLRKHGTAPSGMARGGTVSIIQSFGHASKMPKKRLEAKQKTSANSLRFPNPQRGWGSSEGCNPKAKASEPLEFPVERTFVACHVRTVAFLGDLSLGCRSWIQGRRCCGADQIRRIWMVGRFPTTDRHCPL